MFRIKKTSAGDGEAVAEAERSEADEAPLAKTPPLRRPAATPSRPLGSPGFPAELVRRAGEMSPAARLEPQPLSGRDRTLIAGKDVRMKGEVLACDKLVIEGDAEVVVSGCKHLQIGHSGMFRGSADVSEADIGGQFDGELTVHGRLAVRPTGRIRGVVRYGQIVIEAGGQIVGDIGTIDPPAAATGSTAAVATVGDVLPAVPAGDRAEEPAPGPALNTFVAPPVRA